MKITFKSCNGSQNRKFNTQKETEKHEENIRGRKINKMEDDKKLHTWMMIFWV